MIKLTNIQRNFQLGDQTVDALDDINLSINDGEYVSVLGPSGSGKSSLLNLLCLLDRPSTGSYYRHHLDENEQAITCNQNIGFVFQFFHLIPRLYAIGGASSLLPGIGIAQLHAALPALPVQTPWNFVLAAEGLAIFIDLTAGVLPAKRAAKLDPVEALRSE